MLLGNLTVYSGYIFGGRSKYDITKHPNYKYLSDADPRNAFNIEKYLSTRLKPKPDEIYEVYHMDLSNQPEAAK